MAEQEPVPQIFLQAFSEAVVPPIFHHNPADALRSAPGVLEDSAVHQAPSGLLLPDRNPYTGEAPHIPPEGLHRVFTDTSSVLDIYFDDSKDLDVDRAREVLLTKQIPFLTDALQGNFLANYINDPVVGVQTPERRATENGILWGNAWPAYNWTNMLLQVMPTLPENAPTHFLAAPKDGESFMTRVREMLKQLRLAAEGKIPRGLDPKSTAPLWRTVAFIKTGASITTY